MNRVMLLILLTILTVSCNSIRTRNLTGRIVLDDIKESCDAIDFYIKQIKLHDVEKIKSFWLEDSYCLGLVVTITNKLNESICLAPPDWPKSNFVGILPQEMNLKYDTIDFISYDDLPKMIEPDASVDVEVSSYSMYTFCDETRLDNIEPMLDLVKMLKFYYVPTLIEENIRQDTVVINSTHRLRTDANTKITSRSQIR